MKKITNKELTLDKIWYKLLCVNEVKEANCGRIYYIGEVKGIHVEISYNKANDFGFTISVEDENITAINVIVKRLYALRKIGIYSMIYDYGHLYVELYGKKGE